MRSLGTLMATVFLFLASCLQTPQVNVQNLVCRNDQGCPVGYSCVTPGRTLSEGETGVCCKSNDPAKCRGDAGGGNSGRVDAHADTQSSASGDSKGGTTAAETMNSGGTSATGGTIGSGGLTSNGGSGGAGGASGRGGMDARGTSDSGESGDLTGSGGASKVGDAGGTSGLDGTRLGGSGGSAGEGGAGGSGGIVSTGGLISTGGAGAVVDASADGIPDIGQTDTGTGTFVGGPSCVGLAETCGPNPGNESCCARISVPGGDYYRSFDNVTHTERIYPATVATFTLDKFEVTVGRFRAFVEAGMGTQARPPAPGAGTHPLIPGTGWNSAWNPNLPIDTLDLKTVLKCEFSSETWTDVAGSNENRPQNCLDWYLAFAFCAWDGGRLPTESEWNFAAAGGNEQRVYPWGSTAPDPSKASYWVNEIQMCMGDGVAGCSLADLVRVGSKPGGGGKWGHMDLGGNVREWPLDWYGDYSTTCSNCANMTETGYGVTRGGSFEDDADYLRSAYRRYYPPTSRHPSLGVRCASRI